MTSHKSAAAPRVPGRLSNSRWRARIGSLLTVIAVCALATSAASAATAQDEFDAPSWTSLPAATAFNEAPSCQLNAGDHYTCYSNIANSTEPADPYNPEYYLNSAYWPAEERPDIEHYAMNRYGYGGANGCDDNTVHYCFYTDAKKVGYPISHTPKVGDLVVIAGDCEVPGPKAKVASDCVSESDHYWYAMYVSKVFKDGAYVATGGGADFAYEPSSIDSGLLKQELSRNSARYSFFVGLMPKQRKLAAPKRRPTEPTTLVRYHANPVSGSADLKIDFWVSKKVSSVKLTLEGNWNSQTTADPTTTLTNVTAGHHDVTLDVPAVATTPFASDQFVYCGYQLKVGSRNYSSALVSIAPAPN